MNILKFVNSDEDSIEAYNALNMAIILKKKSHNVYIMSAADSYICKAVIKNKISFINNTLFSRFGFIKDPGADIIEIYGYRSENRIAIKKLLLMKKPTILKIYSFPDAKFIGFIKENFEFFDKIIVTTQSIKDELIFNGIDYEKIMVLNPMLVMGRWESAKQIKPATFLQRPYRILTVYRKEDFNSLKFFIDMAKEILKINENVNFMIVGPKDEKIRDLAREYGISHKVDMLGFRNDMPEVMAMAHIYVRTKAIADISRSLIEAMASSVVCVVPQIKGSSDFIISEYNGEIVEPMNLNSYVKTIISLINNPAKMQHMADIGHKYIRDNFSSEIIFNIHEIIYEDLLIESK
ncbi:MAG: glycosyltransferase family 4 protein [Elusimicrobiota bacterium]